MAPDPRFETLTARNRRGLRMSRSLGSLATLVDVERDAILSRVRETLEHQSQSLIAAYLYGSLGRGDARVGSDVDLALLYRSAPERALDSPPRQLEDELERKLGLPVEVVVANDAPPDLMHRILRDGTLLIDRDPPARIRFEVQARNEYFDLLPILDLYRRRNRSVG